MLFEETSNITVKKPLSPNKTWCDNYSFTCPVQEYEMTLSVQKLIRLPCFCLNVLSGHIYVQHIACVLTSFPCLACTDLQLCAVLARVVLQ